MQAAFENIPGNETNTTTLSTKVIFFPAVTFNPQLNPNPMERSDELRGVDEPLAVVPEAYAPTWDIETRAYPDTLGFLLKLILGPPVSTAGNGIITDPDTIVIPVGVTRHVWTAPFGPAGLAPQSAQFQAAYRDQSVFWKLRGAGCASLALTSPANGGARVAASGPALYMSRISDPALTVAYETLSILPFMRGNLSLPTWLASTTPQVQDFSFTIANAQTAERTFQIASKFPDDLEKGDAPIIITGSVPKRLIGAVDYDALLANTGFAATARWVSTVNVGATSYPYKLYLQMANAQYVGGGPAALTDARRIGATFNFSSTNAVGTAGNSTTITLLNATTSYA